MMPTTTVHVQHDQQLDSCSTASTPRAGDHPPSLRFMCSFGGKILPRPHDNQLRYVGGDTRIIAFSRHTTFSALISKLSKTVGTPANLMTVKYQLPNEDLDALISVSNDEDVENMMEEYERIGSKTARLRLFLFDDNNNNNKSDLSRTNSSSINSLLNGSSRRESWFIDALNGGCGTPTLERGLSEASSIVSEVPDYLFGLDHSDHDPPSPAVIAQPRDPKVRTRSNLADCVSHSDPGSPAPDISSSSPSPFFASTSLAPNLPMVRTKADTPAVVAQMERQVEPVSLDPPVSVPAGLVQSNPMWQYNLDPHHSGPTAMTSFQPMPVYYIPGPVQPGNYPVQAQFVQLQRPQQPQLPVGYHQAGMGQMIQGGGMMRPMGVGLDSYDGHGRVVLPDRSNHPVPGYNGPVHVYPAGVVAAAGLEDQTGSRSDARGSGVGQ